MGISSRCSRMVQGSDNRASECFWTKRAMNHPAAAGASPFQNFVWRNLTLLEASSKGTCKAAVTNEAGEDVTNEAGEDLGLPWITFKIIQHWLSIFNLSRLCHLSKFFSNFSNMHQNAISGAEAKGHGPLRVRVCHSLHSEPLQYWHSWDHQDRLLMSKTYHPNATGVVIDLDGRIQMTNPNLGVSEKFTLNSDTWTSFSPFKYPYVWILPCSELPIHHLLHIALFLFVIIPPWFCCISPFCKRNSPFGSVLK